MTITALKLLRPRGFGRQSRKSCPKFVRKSRTGNKDSAAAQHLQWTQLRCPSRRPPASEPTRADEEQECRGHAPTVQGFESYEDASQRLAQRHSGNEPRDQSDAG